MPLHLRLALVTVLLISATALAWAGQPSGIDVPCCEACCDSCPAGMGRESSTPVVDQRFWATLIDRLSFGFVKIEIQPSNATRRINAMLNQSEDLPQIEDEWARFWFTDQPSHLTYDRIHGGIQPE